MNRVGEFLRNLGASLRYAFSGMMQGRYGMDKMNIAILVTGLIVSVIASVVRGMFLYGILSLVSYALVSWAIYRAMSRKISVRYDENRRYQMLMTQLKDRQHRYYHCPKCRQMTRVPRGKGRIAITCPRCGEKFIKKS